MEDLVVQSQHTTFGCGFFVRVICQYGLWKRSATYIHTQ
jgi:hypothetical protein